MKISTKIKAIEFPTLANGTVGCLLRFEHHEELEKLNCGGMNLNLLEHVQDGFKLPFIVGSVVELDFNDKEEIEGYKITTETDDQTSIPTVCSHCGEPTKFLKDTKITDEPEDKVYCENVFGCNAQSVAPILRLVRLVVGFLPKDSLLDFVKRFPDAPLSHLSDLKMYLRSDPNTAFRENSWADFRNGWIIEKAVWNYLQQSKMSAKDFWFIGFGVKDFDVCPNRYLSSPEPDFLTTPEVIYHNRDRVEQLVGVLDKWCEKEYVTKAY